MHFVIKKAFRPLYDFLVEHGESKVKDVLRDIANLCASKRNCHNFYMNAEGHIVLLFCNYYKQWFFLADMPFGTKQDSASGYQPISKSGYRLKSKAEQERHKENAKLLKQAAEGSLDSGEVQRRLMEMDNKLVDVPPHPLGFDTIEQALKTGQRTF